MYSIIYEVNNNQLYINAIVIYQKDVDLRQLGLRL